MDWTRLWYARRVLTLRHMTPWGRAMLILRAPSLLRLCLALLRDPRVPLVTRAATLGAIALVFSPFDIVQFVPIVGQIGDLVLVTFVLEMFVQNCPREVVREHIAALGLQDRFRA
jgi:uncharacterized membrane protein YkvA (DUF1232 family)